MGLLANFKIRTKVLIALLPLAIMVIVAVLYSSIEMKRIETRYSDLLDRDVKALQSLTTARALDNRFGPPRAFRLRNAANVLHRPWRCFRVAVRGGGDARTSWRVGKSEELKGEV